MIPAHPLCWPDTIPRHRGMRERGQFKATLTVALENVETSLRLFSKDSGRPVKDVVLSSNVTLGAHRPADPGVAAWFTWDGDQVCIPVDRYATVEANLQAIHHIVEARRVEMRHGTLALVKASFRGFRALPAPASKRDWRDVLGFAGDVQPSRALVIERYRSRASSEHPDRGGSDAAMSELNAARDEALRAIGP